MSPCFYLAALVKKLVILMSFLSPTHLVPCWTLIVWRLYYFTILETNIETQTKKQSECSPLWMISKFGTKRELRALFYPLLQFCKATDNLMTRLIPWFHMALQGYYSFLPQRKFQNRSSLLLFNFLNVFKKNQP